MSYPGGGGGYPPQYPGGAPPGANPNLGFGGAPPQPGGYSPYPGGGAPGPNPYPPSGPTPYLPSTGGAPQYPLNPPGSVPGYPPSNPGYPQAPGGYPGAPGGAYPPSQPGYPSSTPGYPQAAPGGGYPPAAPGGYPQAPGGAAPGYPPAPGGAAPGYPPSGAPQSGYPQTAASGYPPSAPSGGYPGATTQSSGGYPGVATQSSSGLPVAPTTGGTWPTSGSTGPSSYTAGVDQPYREIPTIRPASHFDRSGDAAALRKAMKGFGTDEAAIINILGRRTSQQRQEIKMAYTQSFGRDLLKDLKSELSGKFEDVILALMTPLPEYLAKELRGSIQGIGTNEKTMIEILCTNNNAYIHAINGAYQHLYKKPMQEDISSDTSGHFGRLMASMACGFRDEANMDPGLAPGLAQQLYKAGEGKMGTNEQEFNRILSSYSYPVLRMTFDEYKNIKGKSFGDALDAELSGDLKAGMKAIYFSIQNRAAFFAMELHGAMKGAGTRDRALIRIIVSRSEIDLVNIKQEYQRQYGKTLESAIKSETSGDYKRVLLVLAEG